VIRGVVREELRYLGADDRMVGCGLRVTEHGHECSSVKRR